MESLKLFMMTSKYKVPLNDTHYIIQRKDPLFWCFFVLKYGLSAYEAPGVCSFTREKEEKYLCIQDICKNHSLLKSHKIHNKDGEIEADLANTISISIKTFIALCIVYDIDVMFIQHKKAFWWNDSDTTHIVKYYDDHVVGIMFNEDAHKIKETFYRWENIDRPIKVCTAFKHHELLALCQQLELDCDSRKHTKAELYSILTDAIL